MSRIFLNRNKWGKGSFTLRTGLITLGKADIHITAGKLLLLDIFVKDKHQIVSVSSRLIEKVMEYAEMYELRVINLSLFPIIVDERPVQVTFQQVNVTINNFPFNPINLN